MDLTYGAAFVVESIDIDLAPIECQRFPEPHAAEEHARDEWRDRLVAWRRTRLPLPAVLFAGGRERIDVLGSAE